MNENHEAMESGQDIKQLVNKEKIEHYLSLTAQAFEKIKLLTPEPSHLRKISEDFLRMARSYYKDSLHFLSKGDYVNAFAAVNYAHGWLDAGARLGLFDVGRDDRLFTLSD